MQGRWRLLLLASFLRDTAADHPCESEVSTACPDTPASELGKCLNNPAEHASEIELSSECTDFIALNKACGEDIAKSCDEAYFSQDTILCLKTWVDPENLSEKCKKVMQWAIPEEEEEEVTDELGMSEQDKEEKKEWQAKRKAIREEAIGRMAMKEVDKKKEEDRASLEKFKEDDPEGYAQMIQQQEEEAKQQAEFKRQERKQKAAYERAKRAKAGLDADADESSSKSKTGASGASKTSSKTQGSWLSNLVALGILGIIGVVIYTVMGGGKAGGGGGGGGGGGSKKKQGKKNK